MTSSFVSATATQPGRSGLEETMKDPDNDIVYLAFKIEPDGIADLMVVYFYNPLTRTLILKTILLD